MEKFNELLEKLQSLNITQTSGDWADNLPNNIWENYFKGNYKIVKHGLNVDTHRWYEVSTTVIEIFDSLLGVTCATNLFSESMGYEDCDVTIEFKEMKEIQTTSYTEA